MHAGADTGFPEGGGGGEASGAGTIFFLGGGVDMPSDCQNLGGGAQAYPFN